MAEYAIAPAPVPTVPVEGESAVYPVRRILCVGQNYAAHRAEMGGDDRNPPFFFSKPADAVVPPGRNPRYPSPLPLLSHTLTRSPARLLTKLKSEEAEEAWHTLLERNADCYDYYRGFLANRGLALDAPNDAALQAITALSDEFARARAPKRLALLLATGEDFKQRAEAYITSSLEKGIPSLFSDLKSLDADAMEIVCGFINACKRVAVPVDDPVDCCLFAGLDTF